MADMIWPKVILAADVCDARPARIAVSRRFGEKAKSDPKTACSFEGNVNSSR
jgi:hypothetical protein